MKSLFPLLWLIGIFNGLAQSSAYKDEFINRRTLGVCLQQALPSVIVLPEGKRYNSTGILANFHQPLFRTKKNVNLGIDITPQYWIAYAHVTSVEFGLNASANINFQFRKKSILSFHAGSGFHYIGMTTTQQARGFAFSDNFFAAYKRAIQLKNEKRFDIGFVAGFRHMSNLRIKPPNGGIENLFFGICLDRIF